MHDLRKFLSWLFAISSLVCLWIELSYTTQIIHRHINLLHQRYLLVPTVFTFLTAVYGAAWWTIWRGRPSGRGWGIAASLTNILFPVSIMVLTRSVRGHFVLLSVGVAGLIAFARRYEQPNSTARTQENLRLPGDGTIDLVNKIAGFLVFVVSVGVYSWWIRWLRAKDFPAGHSFWDRSLMFVLIVFIISTLHELGHTATGLALGMKLRAFLVGPFQWRIRDGKWSFQFNPAAILSGGGATGVVPTTADFPRWRTLCVVAAGPLFTLLTGTFALWIAFAAKSDSAAQAMAPLSLLGAWSLVLCAVNLVPLRIQGGYSDGAQIYQLMSDGPWGDFHRVGAVVGSSLVTPLRPRDFDIQAIQRAAHSITQGMQGLILRLYSYIYFLDTGKTADAGEALREAESIYHQSALDIPAELHTDFVFGNAYVRRDAAAAREWWTRMEAKKPNRFNADYWRAAGALHWIEGDLKTANEAWEKANALAQQLPKAGAYEFERYCCSLLREALDEASVQTTVTV